MSDKLQQLEKEITEELNAAVKRTELDVMQFILKFKQQFKEL